MKRRVLKLLTLFGIKLDSSSANREHGPNEYKERRVIHKVIQDVGRR